MQQWLVTALALLLAACSTDRTTNPAPAANPLAGHSYVSVQTYDGNAFDRDGNVIRITDQHVWHFADSTYTYQIWVTEWAPVEATPTFDWAHPRLEYTGRYWLDFLTDRRAILTVERTEGHFHSRLESDLTLESPPGLIELPVLIGVDVIAISETAYRSRED